MDKLLPVVTLALGSALTMAGQALRDRRAAERERGALRAEFLSTNFEVHRTALLEMQELVRDGYNAFVIEKRRRSEAGFYDYFDSWPQGLPANFRAVHADQEELARLIDDEALTKNQKAEMAKQLAASILEGAKSLHYESVESLKKLEEQLNGIYPFWESYIDFMSKLRLQMVRSGSNSVVVSGEEFITTVFRWSEQFRRGERLDELSLQVIDCRQKLDQALANALKYGPYNKMDKKRSGEQ